MSRTLSRPEFVGNWKAVELTERAAAQSHFIDLCDMLGEPRPASDPTGESYAFEKGVTTTDDRSGFADVWKRGFFAWEYKGKHKDLNAAYKQLLRYREDLENPPLLVVCDMDRFEVHTNFTGTAKQVYRFGLDDLLRNLATGECALPPLEVLRALFRDPSRLRPNSSAAEVTELAADRFASLADSLRGRGNAPQRAAHFLMRLLFCLFAEDIGLLPSRLFSRLIERTRNRTAEFQARLSDLFRAMATGGAFGVEDISYFNGDLFTDAQVLDLSTTDLDTLMQVSRLDWSSIEPAIFGTLFERSLDPDKRSQLGAHYTSREDILLIVEPVLMAPLRRRWLDVKAKAEGLLAIAKKGKAGAKQLQQVRRLLLGFLDELSQVRVLDPACGSGNFLYVSLKLLLDLAKEVSVFGFSHQVGGELQFHVTPSQMYGIEKNVYAHELASVVVWIGYLQWLNDNGSGWPAPPILQRLDNIHRMDAVLAYDENGKPVEPEWPEADVIVGNPPFLGDKKMREGLGDKYVEDLRALYSDRLPGGSDLVTYWFEKGRAQLEGGKASRVGLLATNSITMIANRKVLERIKAGGDIFMAWSDRPWVLDGADVRVAMVGFDSGTEIEKRLEGGPVSQINADLTAGTDVTKAVPLPENDGICFLGMMKGGPFDIDEETAQGMLAAPNNPNGRLNSDVVKPRLAGSDVVRRPAGGWVIDFGTSMSQSEAALYELPFEHVKKYVLPIRAAARRKRMREKWWLHGEARPGLRRAITSLSRCIVTPEVAKHRIFAWMPTSTIPDHKLHVIARNDDYFFGILQSRIHEAWSLAQGAWIGVGNDPSYSSSRTFETFPFPWPPGKEPTDDPRVKAIAATAKELVEKRDAWLNPPGASAEELKKRTLTNLYNQHPQWLADAHLVLDKAVLGAYGWPENITDAEILERLLALNLSRAAS